MQDDPLIFYGLKIQRCALADSLSLIHTASLHHPIRVFWVNAHAVCVSQQNPTYKQALQDAEFLLNDGVGIELAGFLLKKPIKANLNGTDWIPAFFSSQPNPTTLFLLGAKEGVVQKAKPLLEERWPHLRVIGFQWGYFSDAEAILQEIEQSRPTFLLVGMGMPLQELFITEHWERLQKSGVRIALAVGAFFDLFTEKFPRAPFLMRLLRLEWAFRLLLEPRRLFSRYLVEGWRYLALLWRAWRHS